MDIAKRTSIDFTRIFDIPEYQKEKYPNVRALNHFTEGHWQPLSIEEVRKKADALSCWFIRSGYRRGDKIIMVPIMGDPAWMILDFAAQQAGIIAVPVHPTARTEEIDLILAETQARLCVTADVEIHERFLNILQKSDKLIPVYHLDGSHNGYFEAIKTAEPSSDELDNLHALKQSIDENQILTILYTSGSSGTPKGVVLTHLNVVSNIKAILTLLPLEPGQRVLSFLPFSHIFERTTCYAYLAFGVSLYFSQNKESFARDFKAVRPHFCTCVPRVLEKMHDFMQEQILHKGFIKKKLVRWAMEVGKQYKVRRRLQPAFIMKLFIARILVLNQWKKNLGGKIRYMAVGAASLRPDIGRLFTAAGIVVVEGYGMTETSPIITMNRYEPGLNRFGTVGMAIPGVEIKIDQPNEELEGEILVKGPNVTPGYFGKPELTREAFTEDGWFRTGDVGKFVHQRFLQITDRKKDIFKTSSGKYIAPLPLQIHFTKSPFIQRCLVIGFQRPFVTALIVPHFPMLEAWCTEAGIHWTSPQFMVHNIKVRAKVKQEIDALNEPLPNFQRIRDFVLCPEEWTIENGEITNTLKPVRHRLVEHHLAAIEKMYAANQSK